MCRHSRRLGRYSIRAPPQTRHRFGLGIKVQAALPVKIARSSSCYTSLIPREGEHGEWDWNGNVDAHLPGLDVLLEAGGGAAAPGEDGNTVAVLIRVDQLGGFVNGRNVHADEDGTEYLLGIAFHMWFYVGNDGRADLSMSSC